MPRYHVTDPETGKKAVLTGDSPPTEQELIEIFSTLGPAESKGVNFSLGEMASNVPGSAVQYGKDIVHAVMNPIDTAKSAGRLAQDLGNKLGRNAAELMQGQEIEPMPEYSEAVADAVGQAIKGRYGSADELKNTLMNDPVGMLADISGAGMVGRIPKVSRIAAAMEPVNATAKAARSVARTVIPKDAARKLYQSAAKFSTTLKPAKRESVVRTALREGAMPTSKGVVKIQNRADILNNQLDDLIAAATNRGVEIPVGAVFQHLQELRKTKGGVRLGAGPDLKAIDKIAGAFHKHMKQLGKRTITPEELQEFKISAYKDINWDAKRLTGAPIKEDTYKAMARGAKDALAKEITEAGDINKLLGELYELQPHLIRAANRIDNRNMISINTPLNVGVGGIVGNALGSGPAGISAGAITAALGMPKMKARIAIVLNKLKEGDVGWIESNIGRAEVRIALALAGRLEEELSDQ